MRIDIEEREHGGGFMQKRNGFMRIGLRISGTVSSMNTEMQASRIKLRDNAARFKQEKKII